MALKEQIKKIMDSKTKFIVITGGVCSSIGKGVLVSSIGVLLKNSGYSVSVIKWDPYLNVDPGTMSPLEHGEVFVTCDGAETDLDLGHYERTLGIHLKKDSSVSSGQIFKQILEDERKGKYLGRNVQLVPHVVDAIKERLFTFAQEHKVEYVIVEIGGTVGDIEGQIFLEAIRQARLVLGSERVLHSHLSYVPTLEWIGEVKTKPTQHSVNTLKQAGLTPDFLFLRSQKEVPKKSLEKLSVMCGVQMERIFQMVSFNPIYNVFLDLEHQELGLRIQEYFKQKQVGHSDLSAWKKLIERIGLCDKKLTICMVAKYVGSNDPYISVVEAIKSAGYASGAAINLVVLDAEKLEEPEDSNDTWKKLKMSDGLVGPGGFDSRGVEGKINAVCWARKNNIPYLGLCLGFQVMLIEFGRTLVGLAGANSTEMDKNTKYPVISLLEEQEKVVLKGGSMRLGEMPCTVLKNTKAHLAYDQDLVLERHRHRYEFNNSYKLQYEKKGIVFSGVYQDKDLIEIAELDGHPFMVGSQFHPEFLSSPLKPHPLFKAFIEAALKVKGL